MHGLSISTKMPKEALLATLRENRKNHVELYKEALEGYLKETTAEVKSTLKKLEEGRVVPVRIHLSPPESHVAEYDTVIGMYERDVRTTVTLDGTSYRMLVEDQWTWTSNFLSSNAMYSDSIRGIGLGDTVAELVPSLT